MTRMALESVFIDTLCATPGDPATVAAYGDWLMERDRPPLKPVEPTGPGKHYHVKQLVGSVLARCRRARNGIVFVTVLGQLFTLGGMGPRANGVAIDDIVGDLDDMVGATILACDDMTLVWGWHSHSFVTRKGRVNIYWRHPNGLRQHVNNYYQSVELDAISEKDLQELLGA